MLNMEEKKTGYDEELNKLFDELVPASGKADTMAGELVRAICRISYRWYNDGDQLGIGYGKETCNPAGRYLGEFGSDEMAKMLYQLIYDPIYDDSYDGAYEAALIDLEGETLKYLKDNPELRTMPNEIDMWELRDKYEDVDDTDSDYMDDEER